MYNLLPLTRGETTRFPWYPETLDETLFTGSYPGIFDQGHEASDWLRSYIATYIERDVRTISNVGDLSTFQRFVTLCAGRTAQLLNFSSLAGDCGISQPTAKAWFSILETSFYRFPPSGPSHDSAQAPRENAEAAFPRFRARLLAAGHPCTRTTARTSTSRRDLRILGGLGDRQATGQSGRSEGYVVLTATKTEQRRT